MKLRIKDDSLRLRLTQAEVGELAERGKVERSMHLATGDMRYRVLATDVGAPEADFDSGTISVRLPSDQVLDWVATDTVGIAGQHGPLSILVEKDFACLVPREGEDDTDAFPHPRASS